MTGWDISGGWGLEEQKKQTSKSLLPNLYSGDLHILSTVFCMLLQFLLNYVAYFCNLDPHAKDTSKDVNNEEEEKVRLIGTSYALIWELYALQTLNTPYFSQIVGLKF